MRYILRRFVAGVAVFVGLLVYGMLRDFPFAIDVAICVGFTVEVAGLVITARLMSSNPGKPMRPMQQMLLIHGGFLLGVVVIERVYPVLQLLFPGGPTQHGRQGSWALLITVTVVGLLGYVERYILLQGPKQAKAGVWADTVIGAAPAPAAETQLLVNGVPMGQASPTVNAPLPATVSTPSLVATAAPAAVSAGYTSLTGLTSTPETSPATGSLSTGYSSITGLVSAPEPPAAQEGSGPAPLASTGDDYEGFLQHMKQGKRPFRKPGMSVNDEFQAWLADRARVRAGVPEKRPSGLGRFLQVGRNVN